MDTATPPARLTRDDRLGHPFLWLWGCFTSSSLADGVYQVALPVAALQVGGGPTGVALVLAASRAPWVLLSLHAGVLVDRADRRRLLTAVTTTRVVLLLGLAGLLGAGIDALGLLVVAAFVMGASETIFDTALHSTTPRVTQVSELEWANGRLQATEMVANQFVGPSLGGVLAGLALSCAFGSTAALYLAALLALTRLRVPPMASSGPEQSIHEAVRAGCRALVRDRTLFTYALGGGVVNCGFAAFYAALPVLALGPGPLGLTAARYGLLLAAPGVGGLVVGVLATPVLRRLGSRRTLLVASAALAAGFAAPGVVPRTPYVAVGLVATGLVVLTNVATVSYRQRAVSDHLLGRVTAAYRLFAFGGLPLGSALAGVLMGLGSPRVVFLVAGALVLMAGCSMALATKPAPPTGRRASGPLLERAAQ